MSVNSWSSFAVGATGAVVAGAVALFFRGGDFDGLAGDFIIASTVVGAGLVLGLAHRLALNRVTYQINALAMHIDAMARADTRSTSTQFQPGDDVAALAATIDRSVGGLRSRIENLTSQRRELEVQARIAEAERRDAEAILNSITDAVIVTDAFNEVALANEAAARVLGFDLHHARRRPLDRVIHDPTLIELIKDTRESGQAPLRRHVEHKISQGAHRDSTYDVTLACVTDGKGRSSAPETAGVVAILRDITREKEISEMKSDFVSNVSHELRTPLSSIKAYMEMLIDGEARDEETRAEFYNIIQGEANRLSRLIDNILNISRIESGVVKIQRENVSLSEVVKEVIDVLLPQARAKNIELIDAPTPLFFQVFADKDMISQAVLNLMGNAIKYTMPGGKVSVSINVDEGNGGYGTVDGGWKEDKNTDPPLTSTIRRPPSTMTPPGFVRISVTDTGVGVPPADLPHLFEKFYRVADHKKLAKGTGLGLNLVKHVIETVHGGKVGVLSEVGKGSTFTFSLPMAENGN